MYLTATNTVNLSPIYTEKTAMLIVPWVQPTPTGKILFTVPLSVIDHNITVSGAVKDLPYRVSVGFTNQEGILKNSDFKRVTAALNLNPSFFDDHLTMNLNAKGMYARSAYADGGAVGAAVKMDPTQDPYNFTSEYHKAQFGNALDQTLQNYGGIFPMVIGRIIRRLHMAVHL